MSDPSHSLAPAERAEIIGVLTEIRRRFNAAGEMLAAVHLSHVLDCLTADGPQIGEGV